MLSSHLQKRVTVVIENKNKCTKNELQKNKGVSRAGNITISQSGLSYLKQKQIHD